MRSTSTASWARIDSGWYEPPCSSPIAIGTGEPRRTSATMRALPGGTTSSIQPSPTSSIERAKSMASCACLNTQLQSIPSQQSGPIAARAARRRARVSSGVAAIGCLKRRQPASSSASTCAVHLGRREGRRIPDDRRHGHRSTLSAEIGGDRLSGCPGRQVPRRQIDERQGPQPDPARQNRVVAPRRLPVEVGRVTVRPGRRTCGAMFRRTMRSDRPVAGVDEGEALETGLGADAAERELAMLHHPRPEADRHGQRSLDRDHADTCDRVGHANRPIHSRWWRAPRRRQS